MSDTLPTTDLRQISTAHLRLWYKEYIISKLAGGIKAQTLKDYNEHLEVYLKWVDSHDGLGPMYAATLEGFLAEFRRNHAPHTVMNTYQAAATFFNWLVRRSFILAYESPTQTVDRPLTPKKRMKYVRIDEFEQLYNSIGGDTWMMWRDRALLLILFYSGLRASETLNLKVHNIERTQKVIFVLQGKGDKDRIVPYAPMLEEVLNNYLMRRPECKGIDHLFVASDGFEGVEGPLSYMGFVQMMRRRCAKAGLPQKLNIHSFRHGFAMWALNNGVEMSALSTMMGHSSVAITAEVYASWVPRGLLEQYHAAFSQVMSDEAVRT